MTDVLRAPAPTDISFLWLEITGKCQLECGHCYAESSPAGLHSRLGATEWFAVIEEAWRLGVRMVQFIGGEPTLHPDLPRLIEHALEVGLQVEVFSNLVRVTPRLWELFGRDGVRLATSYYSISAAEHAAITGRDTFRQTRANIAKAVRRQIPIRVGLVQVEDEQQVDAARLELVSLGVTDIGFDRLREVGRGVRGGEQSVGQLCGNCADGVAAISPDGAVWPCVFSRWLPVGNVRTEGLAAIMAGASWKQTRAQLREEFAGRQAPPGSEPVAMPCVPNMCNPDCGPSCSPACRPANNCRPVGACVPSYR